MHHVYALLSLRRLLLYWKLSGILLIVLHKEKNWLSKPLIFTEIRLKQIMNLESLYRSFTDLTEI